MYLFEAQDVTKQYAGHKALDRVSISVPDGSIFGLLGPNGAGKTTLIRIINDIIAPDSGKLLFKGKEATSKMVEQIGYLPEERGLYKKMKVGEQALYLAQLKGLSKKEATKRLKEWFEKFEINSWWNKKVEELSKGMQQKIQFIVTVVHDPKLLIFDEPFSGFDPINVNILKDEILKLRDNGATIIFSTHNMESVEELCDHIALIDRSKKILEGKMKEIKDAYKTNSFEIAYKSSGSNLSTVLKNGYEVLTQWQDDEMSRAKIRIKNNDNPNKLLKELIPHIEIHSFNEILPSMNEIFIRKVEENKFKN
jgi:ABC-2 type transport system ATP-binding protein